MIDWSEVLADAVKAAQDVVGVRWPSIAKSATAQIAALVENAKFIEDNKAGMTDLEYQATKINQQRALKDVLTGFAAISTVVAEQVAAAVWGVVEGALRTVPELAPFV